MRDSNPRPLPCKGSTLTTELIAREHHSPADNMSLGYPPNGPDRARPDRPGQIGPARWRSGWPTSRTTRTAPRTMCDKAMGGHASGPSTSKSVPFRRLTGTSVRPRLHRPSRECNALRNAVPPGVIFSRAGSQTSGHASNSPDTWTASPPGLVVPSVLLTRHQWERSPLDPSGQSAVTISVRAVAVGYFDSQTSVDRTKSSFSVTPRPGPSGGEIQPSTACTF